MKTKKYVNKNKKYVHQNIKNMFIKKYVFQKIYSSENIKYGH